ncbi:hypothetical protein SAMN04487995_4727 [Dyadobacter koreensis]|uniref:Uncharacterized protein n=1 Tax=Dyadobacter koreensis TaxID=408657 RepID=A0A1H6Z1N2_9BACT|nr:hypothetical protein [Dyadobacter koreensis]SEJ45297.1 hypothetical protein SAMN04487995_4727 [Dyadobacter koreensis]
MSEMKDVYNKLSNLLDATNERSTNRFLIMKQANDLIKDNSAVRDIFLEEFKSEIENYLDQHPFESAQHVENDLRRLIQAIRKKHQID